MHLSQFANDLTCPYCSASNSTSRWPVQGDYVGFYFQRESGKFSLDVHCPHCLKTWYVVWDQDPGPIEPLGL